MTGSHWTSSKTCSPIKTTTGVFCGFRRVNDFPFLLALQFGLLSPVEKNLSPVRPHVALLVDETSIDAPAKMKKKTRPRKKQHPTSLGVQYKDPGRPGSLGGLQRFARAHQQTCSTFDPTWKKNWLIPYTNRSDTDFRP